MKHCKYRLINVEFSKAFYKCFVGLNIRSGICACLLRILQVKRTVTLVLWLASESGLCFLTLLKHLTVYAIAFI